MISNFELSLLTFCVRVPLRSDFLAEAEVLVAGHQGPDGVGDEAGRAEMVEVVVQDFAVRLDRGDEAGTLVDVVALARPDACGVFLQHLQHLVAEAAEGPTGEPVAVRRQTLVPRGVELDPRLPAGRRAAFHGVEQVEGITVAVEERQITSGVVGDLRICRVLR